MFMLGPPIQTIQWTAAKIALDLIPLPEDVDRQYIKDTIKEIRDENGKVIDVERDVNRYAQLVGRHCIKGWSGLGEDDPGVVDANKKPIACTPDAIDQFMLIGPAQNFVFEQVKSLALYLIEEKENAKKDSPPSSIGSDGADPKPLPPSGI